MREGPPGARPRLWGRSPARGGLRGSLKQQRRRDWSGAPRMDSRADQRWGSLRVAAGLKMKSEAEGTLPRMLRAETSSCCSPWKADVWVGRVGAGLWAGQGGGQVRRKQRMRAGQLALSAGSPVHSLRPQLPCPPALTTCWGGPDFKAVVLHVDNLEKRFDFLRTVDGRTGGRAVGVRARAGHCSERAPTSRAEPVPSWGAPADLSWAHGEATGGKTPGGCNVLAKEFPQFSTDAQQRPGACPRSPAGRDALLRGPAWGAPPAARCVRVCRVCVCGAQAAPARVQQSAGPLSALQGWEQLDGAAPLRVSGTGVGGFGLGLGL